MYYLKNCNYIIFLLIVLKYLLISYVVPKNLSQIFSFGSVLFKASLVSKVRVGSEWYVKYVVNLISEVTTAIYVDSLFLLINKLMSINMSLLLYRFQHLYYIYRDYRLSLTVCGRYYNEYYNVIYTYIYHVYYNVMYDYITVMM